MKKKILLVSGILVGIAAIGFGIKKSKKLKMFTTGVKFLYSTALYHIYPYN